MTPKHKHDCEECEYKGSLQLKGKWFDFYRCKQGKAEIWTTLARYGDEGPDYFSFPDMTFPDTLPNHPNSLARIYTPDINPVMEVCGALAISEAISERMEREKADEADTRLDQGPPGQTEA